MLALLLTFVNICITCKSPTFELYYSYVFEKKEAKKKEVTQEEKEELKSYFNNW